MYINIIIDYFKQNDVDIVNWLAAIATIVMCFFSLLNILNTKTKVDYKYKIISTKNLLYSMLALQRNILIEIVKMRIEILKVFIYLFLLKREKINENEFRCSFCFNDDNKTSEETNKKIKNVLMSQPISFEEHYTHYKALCDIIGSYFGKSICDNQMYDEIIYQILKGYLPEYNNIIKQLKIKFSQEEWSLFRDFVKQYNDAIDREIVNGYNDIFDKFYNNTLFKDNMCKDDINNDIEQYIKFLIPDYNNMQDMISKYNKIVNFMSGNINDGVVAKISSDLDKQKIYFLSEIGCIKRKNYLFKRKNYLKKRKERFNNLSYISFSRDLVLDKTGVFIQLTINRDKKNK